MAGFLSKLFTRPPGPPPEVAEALAELNRLARERPALAGAAQLLADLLPREGFPPPTPPLPEERVKEKLAGGVPLLRGEVLPFDRKALNRRLAELCAAIRRHQPGEDADALAEAARAGRLPAEELATAILAGRPEEVHARADSLGLSAGLTGLGLRLTLLPFLAPVEASLAPLRAGREWGRGYCPTCGSWPLLGEFRGLEQVRWLRCGLCAAGWEFPRLACPFCGTTDHRRLGYLHVEGEEGRHRASACDDCRGYVKMLSALGALPTPRLLVADLATLHLDLAAAERGYNVS